MCLAVPAKVLRVEGLEAEVSFGGVRRGVSLQLLPETREGDYVLVHTGFAIARLDPAEAEATLALLASLNEPPAADEDAA